MALTTRTLPSLMNGISRQPAILRSQDQTEDELNTWGEIALGLSRRPPTTIIKKLTGLTLGDATVHHINRDINERYTVIIDTGVIKVFDESDGTEKTVAAPLGWGYLDAPGGAYRAVTVADYTFIVNTQKEVLLKGVAADETPPDPELYWLGGTHTTDKPDTFLEAMVLQILKQQYNPNTSGHPGAITGSVPSKDKLPDPVCSGCLYQVKGASETSFVSYYVLGDGSVWNETVKPGLANALDELTMPHALVRKADGTFEFAPFSWQPRRVGDLQTNPYPPFVGRTIKDVFFYQNRMGFVSDESIIFSAAGDYGDFFRKTVLDYIDSDALAAAASTPDVAALDYAVPFADGVMLFSRQRQFSVTNGDSGLSAHSLAIQPVTTYVMSEDVRPAPMGSVCYFTADAAGHSVLLEYTRLSGSDPTEAADVSAHVPGLLPKGASKIITSVDQDVVFVLVRNAVDPADRKQLFAYEFFWDGDKKLKSAWRRWTFDDGIPVSGAYNSGALHLLMERDDGFYLERIDLNQLDVTENQTHQVFLDRSQSVTGVYNAVADTTTFTLGFTPVDNAQVRLVRAAAATLPESTINPAQYVFGTGTVTVPGDESAHPVTIGVIYTSSVTLSRQFPQDWQGRPLTSGRLVIHNVTVNLANTVYLRAEVYPYGAAAAELEPGLKFTTDMHGRILGTPGAALNVPIYYSGPAQFSVAGSADIARIDLVNDSPFASTIVSAEWEGLFFSRAL